MAERFTAIKNETDYLHRWLSYNGREWNTVTGEHRDEMFCDLMVLTRSGGFSQAESWVHSLLDTYRYLGFEPGSLHVMAPEEMKTVVEPVFNLASASRSRVWLRRGVEAKQFDRSGRWIPPVEPEEVHEDYTRTHLTLEAVEYVSGFPERYRSLEQHMRRNSCTLPEVDFSFFLVEQEAHSSLIDGAL